jgi:endogenous inhibitor of DNA gyrase (YacG/DUF329 family)
MTPKTELKRLSAPQIANLRICPHCGERIEGKGLRGPRRSYCSQDCRAAHKAQGLSDGAAIIKLAKAWREARGQGPVGSASFAAMVAALDVMLAADRAAGQPSALYAAAVMLEQGSSYQDRRRAA